MSSEEIVAYIGAAAWLPQIGSWIYNYYITPRVAVIPNRSIELGFTRFGPILNLNMAFSADRRDAIVSDLVIRLTHQDGEVRTLNWVGMSETFSEIRDSTGNRQVVSKDQMPIAFKISTVTLLEKFVRFQEPRFLEVTNKSMNNLFVHFKFLKEKDPDFVQKTLQSKEFDDLIRSHREAFWWKAGKYLVEFQIGSPRKLVVEEQRFSFVLDQIDIDDLRQNIGAIKDDFTETIKSNLPDYEVKKLVWNWRYPVLVPEKD